MHYCLFVKVLFFLLEVFPEELSFLSLRQLIEFIISSSVCQELFELFKVHRSIKLTERRRRDLNPRAAINDLHPFQGCPFGQLGYFSEYITRYLIRSLKISNSIVFLMSGEDGIRTHVPLRTNGFQDRLVMTTSIPLHNVFCCCRFVCLTRRLVYNSKPEYICQHFF